MKEYLPVGSVVLLSGAIKKTMIIGILQKKSGEDETVYDYQGVPYPEGYMGNGTSYLFNHDRINDVIFKGYDNPERQDFLNFVAKLQEASMDEKENQAEK